MSLQRWLDAMVTNDGNTVVGV